MSKVNDFLSNRLKNASNKLSKMTGLAELSTSGSLSSFSGVFRVSKLSEKEQESIGNILSSFADTEKDTSQDFTALLAITSEVKAINNQAAILHGERIKRAQEILKNYKDGAFSAWLQSTYGNRQTPYNFLQYYELHLALPQMLHQKLEEMPRQAVYALASRTGEIEKKTEIIANYKGEPKQEVLTLIREIFPLDATDKRKTNVSEQAVIVLMRLSDQLKRKDFKPSSKQKNILLGLLKDLQKMVD